MRGVCRLVHNPAVSTWQQDARSAALAAGIDPGVFTRQMGQEAHGQDLTSGAGAEGPAQFTPGTARSVGLNSRTVHQRRPAYNAAARLMAGYLKRYGNWRDALAAYNAGPGRVGQSLPPETRNYIATILGDSSPPAKPGKGGRQQRLIPSASGSDTGAGAQSPAPTLPSGSGTDFAGLLQGLLSHPAQQGPEVSPIQAPGFAAAPKLAQGAQPLEPVATAAAQQQPSVSALLSAISGSQGTGSDIFSPAQTGNAENGPSASPGPTRVGSRKTGKHGSEVLELIHNDGPGRPGFGIKNGQVVNGSQVFSGVWAGHANHVHVAAGPKTVVALGRLAQSMGLHVGQNPHFGGVDKVHVPGSYHYKGEAIDVSGDPRAMDAFSRAVERYNRTRRLPT